MIQTNDTDIERILEIDNSTKRKRGRPRKTQYMEESNDKKKRGRKPKQNTKKFCNLDYDNLEEEIILRLPISFKDIKQYCEVDTKDNKNSSSPGIDNNIFTINDLSYNQSSSSEDSINDKNKDYLSRLNIQEQKIRSLESELSEYKNLLNDDLHTGLNDVRVLRMNLDLVNIKNGETVITEKTDIACWWCTYNFDNLPCFIPEKYYDEKYFVFGCFCSFNCAAAYNVNMNDYKIWDRYSLLKRLYNQIHQTEEEITLAPPREALHKFGGFLTIENFRKTLKKCDKEYRFIMPPMISIVPLIEESLRDQYRLRKIRNTESEDKIVLKRTKPLPSTKNTLLEMNYFK